MYNSVGHWKVGWKIIDFSTNHCYLNIIVKKRLVKISISHAERLIKASTSHVIGSIDRYYS